MNTIDENLLSTILNLKTEGELYQFLEGFFTENELKDFFLKWRVLIKTKEVISQRTIAKEEDISLSKVNQIAKILRDENNYVKKLLDDRYDESKL